MTSEAKIRMLVQLPENTPLQNGCLRLEYAAFRACLALAKGLFIFQLQERSLMVTIRLARGGSKKRPFYHLTWLTAAMHVYGRFVERIGFFNPIARGAEVRLSVNQERANYWLGQGAQPSERVAQLLKEAAAQTA